jgi:predicted aspartyl protease
LTNLRSSDLDVPFYLQVLVVGLGLIGWVEAALPAQAFQGKNDPVATIDPSPTLHTPGGVVSTVRAGELLFAAVSINGSSASWWLVDTGATMCEFDLETASRLHLKRSTRYRLT